MVWTKIVRHSPTVRVTWRILCSGCWSTCAQNVISVVYLKPFDTSPAATISKFVRDYVHKKNLRVTGDALDKIVEAGTEFVKILTTQANEVSIKGNKSIISPEHVLSALEILEVREMIPVDASHGGALRFDAPVSKEGVFHIMQFTPYVERVKEAFAEKKEENEEIKKLKRERKVGTRKYDRHCYPTTFHNPSPPLQLLARPAEAGAHNVR